MSHRKRPAGGYSPSRPYSGKRPHPRSPSSPSAAGDETRRRDLSPGEDRSHGPSFPSYLDFPDLPPKTRLLCEILATTTPASAVEQALDAAGLARVSSGEVESVLKLSYSRPAPAVAFFRWAGSRHLAHRHSPYSWNLVVDLLGKNQLFDAMWDAVRSMRSEGLLSLATFASVFSSLAAAGRPNDALAAFDGMPLYGVPRDAAALNSLLSAVCRAGRASIAREFFTRVSSAVPPDADTFAILLEGYENDGDPRAARQVFDDMVAAIGWDPANVPAYDSFLTILLRSSPSGGLSEALKFLDVMRQNRCFPGIKFFRAAIGDLVRHNDARGALVLWEALAGRNGCYPDTPMYNSMITLQCNHGQTDAACQLLDEMVVYGAFPDSQTYNVTLHFLLKGRKLREATAVFNEMVKNDCHPTAANCGLAIRTFLDLMDWEMAMKVWRCMVTSGSSGLEESGNMLVTRLRDMDRLPEACKLAEDMIERGIKLNSSTLSKLRQSLLKVGKGSIHDNILRKWKSH